MEKENSITKNYLKQSNLTDILLLNLFKDIKRFNIAETAIQGEI